MGTEESRNRATMSEGADCLTDLEASENDAHFVVFEPVGEGEVSRWRFLEWKDAARSERGFRHEFFVQGADGEPLLVALDPLCPEGSRIIGPPFPDAVPERVSPCYLVTPPWRRSEEDWDVEGAQAWEKAFFRAHGEVLWMTEGDRPALNQIWEEYRTRVVRCLHLTFEDALELGVDAAHEILENCLTQAWAFGRRVTLELLPVLRQHCLNLLRAYSDFDSENGRLCRRDDGPWFALSQPYRPCGEHGEFASRLEVAFAAVRYRLEFEGGGMAFCVNVSTRKARLGEWQESGLRDPSEGGGEGSQETVRQMIEQAKREISFMAAIPRDSLEEVQRFLEGLARGLSYKQLTVFLVASTPVSDSKTGKMRYQTGEEIGDILGLTRQGANARLRSLPGPVRKYLESRKRFLRESQSDPGPSALSDVANVRSGEHSGGAGIFA